MSEFLEIPDLDVDAIHESIPSEEGNEKTYEYAENYFEFEFENARFGVFEEKPDKNDTFRIKIPIPETTFEQIKRFADENDEDYDYILDSFDTMTELDGSKHKCVYIKRKTSYVDQIIICKGEEMTTKDIYDGRYYATGKVSFSIEWQPRTNEYYIQDRRLEFYEYIKNPEGRLIKAAK